MLTTFTDAYQIPYLGGNYPNCTKLSNILGYHYILPNGDLESKIAIGFYLLNCSPYIPNNSVVIINIDNERNLNNGCIENVSIGICERQIMSNSDFHKNNFTLRCGKSYNYTLPDQDSMNSVCNGSSTLPTYLEDVRYRVSFTPDIGIIGQKVQYFTVLINYTLHNFPFRQGDHKVAILSLPDVQVDGNSSDNNINTLILPSEKDVVRFLPSAREIRNEPYADGDETRYRMAFVFAGGDDKVIWYENADETRNIQLGYMFIGAVISAVIGGTISIFLSHLRRFMWCLIPLLLILCVFYIFTKEWTTKSLVIISVISLMYFIIFIIHLSNKPNPVETDIHHNLEEINSTTNKLSSSITNLMSASRDMGSNLGGLTGSVGVIGSNLKNLGQSVQEINTNLGNTNHTIDNFNTTIESLKSDSLQIAADITKVKSDIKDIMSNLKDTKSNPPKKSSKGSKK
ncbi:MAG: methyl-accepting chemotaxis protein [Candidatus Altiarchaeota archaeon]|nr:methyl-accepting chemotaxis protein [Candidatus Altiarchaeota archaeon]